MACYICENLEAGDTLYASSDWDGGLGFDYIRDIQYCPVCGRKLAEQTEPSLEQFRVGLEYHTDTTHFGKTKGESVTTNKIEDEPQTDCSWK